MAARAVGMATGWVEAVGKDRDRVEAMVDLRISLVISALVDSVVVDVVNVNNLHRM